MLAWAAAGETPTLARLVDHDDAEPEPITTVARRLSWTVVSMADDWATVF
jgi:hypothetical protein